MSPWPRIPNPELETLIGFLKYEPDECTYRMWEFIEEIPRDGPYYISYGASFLDLSLRILCYGINEDRKRSEAEIYSLLQKIYTFSQLPDLPEDSIRSMSNLILPKEPFVNYTFSHAIDDMNKSDFEVLLGDLEDVAGFLDNYLIQR